MKKNIVLMLAVAVLMTSGFVFTGCVDDKDAPQTSSDKPAAKTPAKTPAPVDKKVDTKPVAKPVPTPMPAPVKPAAPKTTIGTKVLIKTTMGDIKVGLYEEVSPITTKNFLGYVNSNYFNGTIFHRVIKGFMIQGGGFTADMKKKPTMRPIINEATNKVRNKRGTLAMARTKDLNSATSQFFINHKDNRSLDFDGPYKGYAVFGEVLEGMDVVDAIAVVPTTVKNMKRDVPVETVEIKSITVINK